MNRNLLKIIFCICMALAAAGICSAQGADASSSSGRDSENIKPEGFLENLAKKKIEEQKKDHEKTVRRTEEILQITQEIEQTFDTNAKLSSRDWSKIDWIEKTVKKIRADIGAKDWEDSEEPGDKSSPQNIRDAVAELKQNSENLVSALKKSTRFTISVVAIQSSNGVLRAIRFVKSQLK